MDRFTSFISKYNNDNIEELIINNNIKKIICNHVIFDLNFLIYQGIIEIENEINDIIKIILSLHFSIDYYDDLQKILLYILKQTHWINYSSNILSTVDKPYDNEIILSFITLISSPIKINTDENIESITLLDIVIYHKITLNIINYINNIHYLPFINKLSIFCDGIPSFSKIIEQRRRRIKNYLETNEKKILFKKYFDNLYPNIKKIVNNLSNNYSCNIVINDNIIFDYSKWIKYRFSIDKTVGPSSKFINNLELFLYKKLMFYLPKIQVTINSSNINGESDFKIFKFISLNDNFQDYCIHTTDSDLIHQMLVQQVYYKIINKDINITIIKYIKNNTNKLTFVQILDGNIIIKNILELYSNVNNIKTNNYKIIWDLCLIFYLFGNDHLPSSLEIGPELGFDYFIKNHYISLGKTNIVNIKLDKINLDINNLLLYFIQLDLDSNNITKIILNRYFKINLKLINMFVDKFKYNFDEILIFLEKLYIFSGLSMNKEDYEKINKNDLRKKLINDNMILSDEVINNYLNFTIFNLSSFNLLILKDNIKLIEENVDYFEHEFMGLILYYKQINLTNDSYQDLYNFISEKVSFNLNKKYPIFYDHININEHLKILKNNKSFNVNNYLKKLYHLVSIQFGNMSNYFNDNLTYYKSNYVPSLKDIIIFLQNCNNDIINIWDNDIIIDNKYHKYFNNVNHHIIISPFLTFSDKNLKNIDNIIFNSNDIDSFEYKNIDIHKYLDTF